MTVFRDIFLYNCEIWTITSSQAENTINAFQQILLRIYGLNVKWPNTVRNEELYRKRRLKQFGREIRAEDSTPGKKAFNYAITHTRDPWQTNTNLAEYYKIRSQNIKPNLGRGNKHCSRRSNMGSHNK